MSAISATSDSTHSRLRFKKLGRSACLAARIAIIGLNTEKSNMPTYDFYCDRCDITIEVVRSIKDDTALTCELCGGKMYQQLSMGEYIVFKGEGWARKNA